MTAHETIRQAAADWRAAADDERKAAWKCAGKGDLDGAVRHAKFADSFERLAGLVEGVYAPRVGRDG